MGKLLASILILSITLLGADKKTITYKSKDGLTITADLYLVHKKSAPFIILFHQAGWSRGEYKEIAPKLNKMGFNCLAVDQRSGAEVNNVVNETHKRAKKAKKGTRYIDAYIDMEASLSYVKENYANGKLIVWGSSYSSALSLKLTAEHQSEIDGTLSFAPGEYFSKQGKSKTFITDASKKIETPVFITSAKNEKQYWKGIFSAIPSKKKHSFLPETTGNHGSRALWAKFADHKAYWKAVNKFLKKYFL